MSTTCTIGLQEENGRIRAIGCWCDGCGNEMWARLIRNYNTPAHIRQLLDLGNIHWLGARLAPNPGERHDFIEPADEVTLAYHRDAGEELVPAREFRDIDEYLNWAEDGKRNSFSGYIYLFDGQEWLIWDVDRWRHLGIQLACMNRTDNEADSAHIAPCGDDCAKCPRFIAVTDEELQKLAELWYRVGWRDSVVSADDMRCGGCTIGKRCSYGILECQAKESVARCTDCRHHPCAKITQVLDKSDYWQRRCKEVCSPDEYAMLEHAFFRKKENLGLSEHRFHDSVL